MASIEDRIRDNSARCSPNKHLEFRGAVAVDYQDQYGKDATRIDLRFTERIDIKLFSPAKSVRMRSIQATQLSSLADALGGDFNDIPSCRGGWEEFVVEVCNLLNPYKGKAVYVKLTVNEKGYIELGEGKCFSRNADMAYTDADLRFLELGAVPDPDEARPFTDDDLPF